MIAVAVIKRFLTVDCLFSPGKKKGGGGCSLEPHDPNCPGLQTCAVLIFLPNLVRRTVIWHSSVFMQASAAISVF